MAQPTSKQRAVFEELKKLDAAASITWDKTTGTPKRLRAAVAPAEAGTPEQIARGFLAARKELFRMRDPSEELRYRRTSTDSLGNRHVRYKQVYKNIPVFGHELIVHVDAANAVRGVNGSFRADIRVGTRPKVTAAAAAAFARKHSQGQPWPGSEPSLVILVHRNRPVLAWYMTLAGTDTALDGSEMEARWEYFVNAETGRLVWRYNNLQTHTKTTGGGTGRYCGAITLNTVHNHASNKYELEDQWMPTSARVYTHDCAGGFPPADVSEDASNNWSAASQREEVDCHHYTRVVYDYFLLTHGRDSYDDAGADMHIYAHVGNNWNNASWNGSYVKVGDGDSIDWDPLGSLDMIAHEWTHAVTEYTASLVYSGESGAINESMSDVFGALIDGDWLHGEDCFLKTTAPAGRNLADPTNGGQYDTANPIGSVLDGHQPDHTDDQYTGVADNGGVHINSGIANKAAYLIAVGGTHRGITICEALGNDVLGRLYYQALSQHLTSTSDFEDLRDAVLDSLDDLYSGDARYNRWQASIRNAFAAVGIGDAVVCPPTCYLAPTLLCPPAPGIKCPPLPQVCFKAPYTLCPPQPDIIRCPPQPDIIRCPPQPDLIKCPPQPGDIGCLPGPDPVPFRPDVVVRKKKTPSKGTPATKKTTQKKTARRTKSKFGPRRTRGG